jgi:hypothetical protein
MSHSPKITSKSLIDLLPNGRVSIMRPTLALRPGRLALVKTAKRWRLQHDGTSVGVSRPTAVPTDQKLPSGHSRLV